MLAQVPVVHSADDLTPEWLAAALDAPAPDGRVAHFVRVAATFRTADGRRGLRWIESNINQKASNS